MYERYTDRARKVMQLANREAQQLNHEYVGTEHILLGIIAEGAGVAANVLKTLDIDLQKIRQEIEKIVQCGPDTVTRGRLSQTPRAKKVIEYAAEEATEFKHKYVGTEHLLLGLLREEEGLAAQILMNLGLRIGDVREQVRHLLGHKGDQAETNEEQEETSRSKYPALDSYGNDLTALARRGKLDPVIGRQGEMERVIQVLCRRTTKSPVLVGEPGVGKAAILRGLAQKIAGNDVTELLRDRRLYSLDLKSALAAGYKAAPPSSVVRAIVVELLSSQNVILLLEELITLIDPQLLGEADYGRSVLRMALIRGQLRCLATLTPRQYEAMCQTDIALARSFQPIHVQPATPAEARDVLHGLRGHFEAFHRVRIEDDAVQAAVLSAERLFRDSCLPGSAVEILDEACALIRMRGLTRPSAVHELDAQIERLNHEKEKMVAEQDFPKAAALRDQVERLQHQKEQALHDWNEQTRDSPVTAELVAEAAGRITALPGTCPH